MFTLVRAYGIEKTPGSIWKDYNQNNTFDTITCVQMFSLFEDLYFELSTTFLTDSIFVNFNDFRAKFNASSQTLNQMLGEYSQNDLNFLTSIPQYTVQTVEFSDAFRVGYKIQTQAPGLHPTSIVDPNQKTEIRMKRPNTDMRHFYENCLVTVNGYFHRLDTDDENVFVLDGGKSLLQSRQNQIGILNFQNIGKVKTIPITASMIYKQNEDSFLSRKAYFDVPGDLTNKTVLAVIGGYLYLPKNKTLTRVNDNVFCIDFSTVPVLERYYDSSVYLDLKALNIEATPNRPDLISVSDFFKDSNFMKYLTLSQSFFVIVDANNLSFATSEVRQSKIPGTFITYKEPKDLLITNIGKTAEYWKQYEDGQWVMTVEKSYYFNRLLQTQDPPTIITVNSKEAPYRRYYPSQGTLLSIRSNIPA